MSDYQRIASAMDFIIANTHKQPQLEEIAAHVQLSPYHFQRLFSRWAGVTPKQFLQVLTLEKAKLSLLEKPKNSLLVASDALGLSSSSRLYDHFVTLQAVTPAEFKRGGEGLCIGYAFHETPFGKAFIAETEKGICHFSFTETHDKSKCIDALQKQWPNALLKKEVKKTAITLARMFTDKPLENKPLSLQVYGTNFQINVWRALLEIPRGRVVSYSDIAKSVGKPKAVRAVGTAVGANPIAFVIPCHRVIRQNGGLGGYRWGLSRKYALLAWETAKVEQ